MAAIPEESRPRVTDLKPPGRLGVHSTLRAVDSWKGFRVCMNKGERPLRVRESPIQRHG